ncbi:hypothetical protein [Paenibacillus albus]|uniref:Uncharacterized protein n=1 Tax=Paenibacillus albus TaxID=2495582 RepID=A0A3Q8X5D3_9BACL|nr:hypothetical protein [Paenibacillus albus]AZN40454.1 hypothetical protein EJC50_12910 [Paenibacillus albus]
MLSEMLKSHMKEMKTVNAELYYSIMDGIIDRVIEIHGLKYEPEAGHFTRPENGGFVPLTTVEFNNLVEAELWRIFPQESAGVRVVRFVD